MKSNISVLEVRADVLSPKSLALISEFALILYRSNGIIIEVAGNDAISQVFKYAKHFSEPRLKEICLALRAELISKYSPETVNKSRDDYKNSRIVRRL